MQLALVTLSAVALAQIALAQVYDRPPLGASMPTTKELVSPEFDKLFPVPPPPQPPITGPRDSRLPTRNNASKSPLPEIPDVDLLTGSREDWMARASRTQVGWGAFLLALAQAKLPESSKVAVVERHMAPRFAPSANEMKAIRSAASPSLLAAITKVARR